MVEKIPAGRVATYGQIARLLDRPRSARAVGYALHVCPAHRLVPCHRVVNRDGRLARAFQHDGINEQRLLLEEEGVDFTRDGCVNLSLFLWEGPKPNFCRPLHEEGESETKPGRTAGTSGLDVLMRGKDA